MNRRIVQSGTCVGVNVQGKTFVGGLIGLAVVSAFTFVHAGYRWDKNDPIGAPVPSPRAPASDGPYKEYCYPGR